VTLPLPRDARHSTVKAEALYLGGWGRLAGNPLSRSWVRRTARQGLRVAHTRAERRRVMEVWRRVHYLGDPARADRQPNWSPIGCRCIRMSYYMDLPCLRPEPQPWIPAACVTIRYALPGGVPAHLGLSSPLEALEIARSFVADDLRWPVVRDLSPAVLREVVRRMRDGGDWAQTVAGRVKWRPRWLLSYADPGVGHDGGLYRGAGAEYLGESVGGKLLFGWSLTGGDN